MLYLLLFVDRMADAPGAVQWGKVDLARALENTPNGAGRSYMMFHYVMLCYVVL